MNTSTHVSMKPQANAATQPATSSKALASLLLSAGVAALVVMADQLMEPWAESHVVAAWIALWAVAMMSPSMGEMAWPANSASACTHWARGGSAATASNISRPVAKPVRAATSRSPTTCRAIHLTPSVIRERHQQPESSGACVRRIGPH